MSTAYASRDAASRALRLALRVIGTFDLAAVTVAFVPAAWIARVHEAAGLGPWPEATIAEYLARSGSLMYALHGALLLWAARDVERNRGLIQFLAIAGGVHGAALVAVDLRVGMPAYWISGEGPLYVLASALVYWLARRTGSKARD